MRETTLEDLQCCGFDTTKYTTYSDFDTSIVTDVLSLGMGNINEIEKPIKVGSIFSSAKHILACLEIAEAKEDRQAYLRTARSQTDRVVFRCKVEGCPFCVRAQKKPLTIHSDSSEWFKITQYVEHGEGNHPAGIFTYPLDKNGNRKSSRCSRTKVMSIAFKPVADISRSGIHKRHWDETREEDYQKALVYVNKHTLDRSRNRPSVRCSLHDEVLAYGLLTDLIMTLQNEDEKGSYYLEVQDLGYELNLPEVHLQNSQNTLKQFRRCALIPSMSKMLFKRTRKIVAINGAVLRGDFGGVSLVIVGY